MAWRMERDLDQWLLDRVVALDRRSIRSPQRKFVIQVLLIVQNFLRQKPLTKRFQDLTLDEVVGLTADAPAGAASLTPTE
jgi:hypothetical protein